MDRFNLPIGVIVDALAIVIGGTIGAAAGKKLKEDFKENMNLILGLCSMCMGIPAIGQMQNMPAVVFAIILGTSTGLCIHLGSRINAGGILMQRGMSRLVKPVNSGISEQEFQSVLVTCITLFCASGTGIYGSITAGMLGDHSILIAKSILDLFTAIVFAAMLGLVVAMVAIPQFILFLILFLCAGLIYPLCTPAMINDFKACGGFIMLATGFRMCKIRNFPVADMIPAMLFVMPISWLWATYVTPYVTSIAAMM